MFGFKKGAFTDAKEDRVGKFQLANKGTLFLDEIGNLPLTLQSKLLVVLQNRSVTPVGGNKEVPINIRLISATNSNIDREILEGRFREDLLYRLNTIKIELPPLRDRGEDIELLASFFLLNYQKKYKKAGLKLSSQTIKKLQKYHWPGNVRELQHAIEKAVILAEDEVLKPDDFSLRTSERSINNVFHTLEEMERSMIEEALDKLDEIMTTPGLSGVYIGPADLSIALGEEPGFDKPEKTKAYSEICRILETAKKNNVFSAIHNGTPEYALKMIEKGFNLVTVGSDHRSIISGAKTIVDNIKGTLKQPGKKTY